jgi:hypothetical protein
MQVEYKKTTQRNSKRTRVILSVLLVLTFLVGGAVIYWNTNKNRIIRHKLEKAINKKTDSLYNIRVDSISVNETAGILEFRDLHVNADSLKLERDKSKRPAELIKLDIPLLRFTGLKTAKALLRDQIVAAKLVISNPKLELNRLDGEGKEDELTQQKLYKAILGDMKFIQVDTIEIIQADIESRNLSTGKKRFEIK